jgi:hypothetical protein
MKLIKKFKWIILGFFILCFILVAWVCKDLFLSADGPMYGDRLEGIDKAPIDANTKKEITDLLLKTAGIKKVETNIHGKILNVIILVDETITVDKVKESANASLDKLSEAQKSFYDVQFLVDYANETKATIYPIIGYKNKNSDVIVW